MNAHAAMEAAFLIGKAMADSAEFRSVDTAYLLTHGLEIGLWIALEKPELAEELRDFLAEGLPAKTIAARGDTVAAIIEAARL